MIMPKISRIRSQQELKLKYKEFSKAHIMNSRMNCIVNSRRTISRSLQMDDIVNSRELCSKVLLENEKFKTYFIYVLDGIS